ncbi:MAG: DEAD/DEAH box helicase family protein [Nitrospirae bacterium]|nr:DEAD/DEAH box helicase family protein [Nitrospirota bacterium]
MKESSKQKGADLFIVDNSDQNWKVKNYLYDWTEIAHQFDIATGFFEIGALLTLDGQWQQLNKIRILMGDEVSRRTKKALLAGVEVTKKILDNSIEKEKEINDFLTGVPAIVDAIKKGQIECRIYTKEKFHAKAYITHAKLAVVGPTALVGSSNFTAPGLTDNVELNIQIRREVELLQEWYERHWNEAEEISAEILKIMERHTMEYTPFEVYVKSLYEFFRGHELTAGEWENASSRMYPVLDQYQKEGYQALMKISRQFNGTFLCDGVGLGKTFIGMMVIERLVEHDNKRVILLVPKAARKPVWESALKKYLPHISKGVFSNFHIFNHTDLLKGGQTREDFEIIKEKADAIVIDEAHHFRNPGIKGEKSGKMSRYRRFYEIAEGKALFLLTATPINNRLIDLQHMIELFSRRKPEYFQSAPLGIHSLPGHFRKMEKALEKLVLGKEQDHEGIETNQIEAEDVLFNDELFKALVVQRSRAYVKASQIQHGGSQAIFPKREDPKVASYSIKKTYGNLLAMIEKAFSKQKPLFSLAMYYPLAFYKGSDTSIDPMTEGRQKEVVALIRTQFLKRFESSAQAFMMSCETLLLKLLVFATRNSKSDAEKRILERWKAQHAEIIGSVRQHQLELFGEEGTEDVEDEDIITEEMLQDAEELSRDEYKVEEMLAETFLDLNEIADFLKELQKFKPSHDDKLKALIKMLKTDPVLKKHKVMIFSEYMATARYLKKELESAGLTEIEEVDSSVKRDRGEIITQFAPYYNDSSSKELSSANLKETRILIATDVLSEGLNLQDATRLINYDLHWNPVRLMQRIGRVDRRLNPEIEEKLLVDHPDQKEIRGTVAYWNFLPPDELDELLRLYGKVSHKTLRISKTFGIEGKKLLRPDDDYEALKDFNHSYEGTTTILEEMHLEYQQLLKDYPDLPERLKMLPGKVFSGKQHPKAGSKGVFFCYALPGPGMIKELEDTDGEVWTEDAGVTHWYLYNLDNEKILDDPTEIIALIRSKPDTPRHRTLPEKTLSEIRTSVEKHIKNTYFKKVQAPVGIKAALKAWMELS